MTTLVVVMAHVGAVDRVNRHMRFWKRHSPYFLFVSDGRGPVQTEYPEISEGPQSSRSYSRWRKMIEYCSDRAMNDEVGMFAFFEDDSISLTDGGWTHKGMKGITRSMPNRLGDYTAIRYANAPWVIDAQTIVAMHQKMKLYPDFTEHGTNDRLIPGLVQLCGIPLMPFYPYGYSPDGGKIRREHFPELMRAIEDGATEIHGIKDEETLKLIEECYDARRETHH